MSLCIFDLECNNIYFSFAEELIKNLNRYPSALTASLDTIELSFNIDGLPLFKSSQNSLWPVLCAIVNIKPTIVFPVVLTYCRSKPNDLGFLDDMITDLNHILEHGLQLHNRRFAAVLRCVVCDAPARAFVKGTKLCSGYFGYDKCCQKGKWVGRIVYPDVVYVELRTDSSFRNRSNEEHHLSQSPFCNLSIDMVKKFPIDYTHQVCLGVMKKLLFLWIRGKRDVRISAGQVNEISNRLIGLKPFIPNVFARRPCGLDEIDRWKATEFRQFLLYSGILALDGILRGDLYNHFLCISVAISILVCPIVLLKSTKPMPMICSPTLYNRVQSQNRDYNRSPTSVGTFDVSGAAHVASRILATILLASKNGGFDRMLLGSSLQKLDYQ